MQVGSGQPDKTTGGGGGGLDGSTSAASKGVVSGALFKSICIYYSGSMTHFNSHFWLPLSQEEFKSSDSHAVTLLIRDQG